MKGFTSKINYYHHNHKAMTKEEIKLDHEIEYNRRMSKSMVRTGLSIIALILIATMGFIFNHYQVKSEGDETKQLEDSVYIYYKGDNGYIRFSKPKDVDYNAFPNHSEIKKPIQK